MSKTFLLNSIKSFYLKILGHFYLNYCALDPVIESTKCVFISSSLNSCNNDG